MFKKLLPVIIVLALLAGYAGYRAVRAQTLDSRASTTSASSDLSAGQAQPEETVIPDTGSSAPVPSANDVATGGSGKVVNSSTSPPDDCRPLESPNRYGPQRPRPC